MSARATLRSSNRMPRHRSASIAFKSRLYRLVAIAVPRYMPDPNNARPAKTVVIHLRNSQ
jgi:hypothetical protein